MQESPFIAQWGCRGPRKAVLGVGTQAPVSVVEEDIFSCSEPGSWLPVVLGELGAFIQALGGVALVGQSEGEGPAMHLRVWEGSPNPGHTSNGCHCSYPFELVFGLVFPFEFCYECLHSWW